MAVDNADFAAHYLRRADARDGERLRRRGVLLGRAEEMAAALREEMQSELRVYLFGSLLNASRFRLESDIDLAVEGLSPSDYWTGWRLLEPLASGAPLDLIRMETAPLALRETIRKYGKELT